LDPKAIEALRQRWFKKSNNQNLLNISDKQLLIDAELIVKDGITYAALILLGTREALGRFLAQAEVIFEYRSADNKIEFQQRKEYRYAFLLFYDDIWHTIDLRNEVQQYQDGFFKWDVPTFNEIVVREGILNAVAHRNYRDPGSVFVKQYPRKLEIKSPGGFPPGITEQNILWEQFPRNRRIAEVFSKCGFVERSGQGVDWMVKNSIRDGKRQPDYSKSNDYHVTLVIDGEIQDTRFLRFLEKVGAEKLASFSTQDFIVLDLIHRDKSVPGSLKERLPLLRDQKVIEKIGHGRGTRYILSRAFYEFLGRKGTYTRKRGLDRETQKELLLKHIRENEGPKLRELKQVLPELTMHQVQRLIRELKKEEKIVEVGRTSAARWYLPSAKRPVT
jgi:ATP-dependent DNA helicase RecG